MDQYSREFIAEKAMSKTMSQNVPMSRFYAQHGENKGLRWRDIPFYGPNDIPLGAHRDLGGLALAMARPPTTFSWCCISGPGVPTTTSGACPLITAGSTGQRNTRTKPFS